MKKLPRLMVKRYNVLKEEALKDFSDLSENLNTLISTPDLDPVTFLGFERQTPYSGEISAPYRLDCALTYKTQSVSSALYAPTKRVERELTEDEWRIILNKAWEAGIPHIIFTRRRSNFTPGSARPDPARRKSGAGYRAVNQWDASFRNPLPSETSPERT